MSTVTVGCKLPNGLIIELDEQRVVLNGANSSNLIGGFGLTEVNKPLFDAWLEKHKDYEPVKQGLIFAQEKPANAQAEARDKAELKNGFEGIDPKKPAKGIAPMDNKE